MTDMNATPITVTTGMIDALRGTKGWVKLVGILLFVAAAFTALGSLAAIAIPSMMGTGKGAMPMAGMVFLVVIYVGMAAIYVFLGLYLMRFASAIDRLLQSGQAEAMETALQNQRKFWRLAGILMLIGMGLAVLGILAAIAIPVLMGR